MAPDPIAPDFAARDAIAHAKAYPFEILDQSYVYENGRWRAIATNEVSLADRVPVLASGSNQSPAQLHRKFGHLEEDVVIPTERARHYDFDSVYAAHLTRYGSAPATLQHSPGTAVTIFITWLTEGQLAVMHATEGNYTYDRLSPIRLEVDGGRILNEAFSYGSRVGCLNHEGGHLSLAAIPADARRHPAMTQTEVLGLVRNRLAPGTVLEEFIFDHLEDRKIHRERSEKLGKDAHALAYPTADRIEI